MSDTPDTTPAAAAPAPADAAPLTPSAPPAADASSANALVLSPPAAVMPVSDSEAASMVALDPARSKQLDDMAASYADSVLALDPHSDAFQKKEEALRNMGDTEIRRSAEVSNRMLDRPVKSMDSGLFDEKSHVAKSLVDLRQTVEDLDPSRQGLLSKKKLFGLIPFGDHLRDYFDKYKSAQSHIDAILNSLYRGQDELRQDNAAIEQEKTNLWTTMGQLNEYSYLSSKLDAALEAKIAAIEATDPAKAKTMKEDLLFPVRQKHQDLLTQLAVSAQGYLALDLTRDNNIEVIKGVDRATTTTVSALRTAVMVAQALANQKLVLDQISALNTTTGNLIESTSELLRDQSTEVATEASSSTIEIQKLQGAFQNIYTAIDTIDTYKVQALDTMKQTIDALSTEVAKAQTYLERAKDVPAQDALTSGELALPPGGAR